MAANNGVLEVIETPIFSSNINLHHGINHPYINIAHAIGYIFVNDYMIKDLLILVSRWCNHIKYGTGMGLTIH